MANLFTVLGFLLVLIGECISAPNELPTRVRDMEEDPDLFEGDIILPPGGLEQFLKNGLIGDRYRWPRATVVFQLDSRFSNIEVNTILDAWIDIKNATCINFRPRNARDVDYVFVAKGAVGSGCSTNIGKIGGRQKMSLAPSCLRRRGTLIHETLHTIGFYHEHSRPDRDNFVSIVWGNIKPGKEFYFQKRNVDTFGVPYDYGSILHIPKDAFSINGNPTILPNRILGTPIGQRIRMSNRDAQKVNLMYKCRRTR